MKRLLCPLLAALVLGSPAQVRADQPPEISDGAEPRDVEVGQPFIVQLSITVDSSSPSPSEPHLTLPDGLRSGPPSVTTRTQMTFNNGRLSRSSGITATWQVLPSREGVFVLTPDVAWSGHKMQANPLRITVHAAGASGGGGGGQRGRRQAQPSPFDPFGMFPRLPGFFDTPDPTPAPEPPQDPELALDAPLDSKVFLRSVVDEKNPVVGQQVTLTVYLYSQLSTLELTDVHEPSIPDFFRRDLIAPNTQPDPRTVLINGNLWRAQPIFKAALFPLKAGDLPIGPMQATVMAGRNSALSGAVRQSLPATVHVTEPPARGRPTNYQIGDVGTYTLSATVDPRTSEVGGAIGVNVTVAGVGNVPNAVHLPVSASFEWLPPQTRENIDVENGKVRGSRSFAYLVRPKVAGSFELGELTLPFWNADRKVYDIARVHLGKVEIQPDKSPQAAQGQPAPRDPWAALGSARTALTPYAVGKDPITEKPFYWAGIFGAPLAVVLGSLGSRGFRRIKVRMAARGSSVERSIADAMVEARRAVKAGDRAVVASSIDRAVHLSATRATGLKARALLASEIARALEDRKVPADLAQKTSALLARVETVRFAPDGASHLAELVEQAEDVVSRLGRMDPALGEGDA